MPRRDFDDHFDEERKEWTERKHDLLARYVVPGAAKIKEVSKPKRVALIDGYAGANEFAGITSGSTAIMVAAARKVITSGAQAVVYAFEPNDNRYQLLCKNLKPAIDAGILVASQEPHSSGITKLLPILKGWPVIAFLDPQAPSEMSLERDIRPYCSRHSTDVLGIFHANNACRDAARLVKDQSATSSIHPREYLGKLWHKATTEDSARQVFFAEISTCKDFTGMYKIRKKEIKREAYAFFGLSDNPHGFNLLSNAIAKDFGMLKEYDASVSGKSLFEDQESDDAFQYLVDIVRPVVVREYRTGQKLAIAVLKTRGNAAKVFGRYEERDYTKAARRVQGELKNG